MPLLAFKALGVAALLAALWFGVHEYISSLILEGYNKAVAEYETKVLEAVKQGAQDATDVAKQNEAVGNRLVVDARGNARRLQYALSAANRALDSIQAGATCSSPGSTPSGPDPATVRGEIESLTGEVIADLHKSAIACGTKVKNIEEKIQ
jgi:hypothetical protein